MPVDKYTYVVNSLIFIPFHLMHDNMKLLKDMTVQCLLPSVKTFTTNGDLDLEDQDHLKRLILKIKIRLLKQRDFEDQDQITIMPISGDNQCKNHQRVGTFGFSTNWCFFL